MNAPRFGLPSATVERIGEVLAQHPRVERAVIYGSRAKGTHQPGSDIDLTLFGEGLQYEDLLALTGELDDLLLPYMIDLSIFDRLDHAGLRDHIERVGQTFYEAPMRVREAP